MKLTSQAAKTMLEKLRAKSTDDRWIDHCLCVGDTAGIIAQALKAKGHQVDVDKTIALGYVHDIGKHNPAPQSHEIKGYEFLQKQGFDEEDCHVCLTHPYLNNDITCTAAGVPDPNKNPFLTNFIKTHEYTLEEKLINLCDLMCPQGGKVYTVDKRLIDIILRKGAYPNTQYHATETYKLKAYFDDLLGFNLYDLFPTIKENL